MNLPNALTLLRIFLVPLLLAAMLSGKFEIDTGLGFVLDEEWTALIVFLAAALTDFLDGYLARRNRQVTTIGKLLDPIADKLLVSAAFISLVELDRVPAWMVVLIVGREFAVSGLRYIALTEGITIAAGTWGKLKMWAQVMAISVLLVRPDNVVADALLFAAVALTLISMVDYFRGFWPAAVDRPAQRSGKTPPAVATQAE